MSMLNRCRALLLAAPVLVAAPASAQTPPPSPSHLRGLNRSKLMTHGSGPVHLRPHLQNQVSRKGGAIDVVRPQPPKATPPAADDSHDAAATTASPTDTPSGIVPADQADDSGRRVLPRDKIKKSGKFKLNFDKVDIVDLVKQIADMTGKMFIVPDNIRGKITVIGPQHGNAFVSAEEVYAAFLAALDANNLTLYPVGRFYRIEQKRSAKQSTIPTYLGDQNNYPGNEQMVTKLFRLKYADLEPVRGALNNLVTQNGTCEPFQPDLLICTDLGSNIHRLEKILGELDQSGGSDTIHIIQVQYAAANDMAEKLTKIFTPPKGNQRGATLSIPARGPAHRPQIKKATPAASASSDTGGEGTPTLRLAMADERTNKLVIIASDKSFDRILPIVKELDVPTAGEGGVHVYYLQNAAATDLATTLSNLTQGTANHTKGRRGAPQAASASASLFSGEVKVTAEKATNSLVIIASDTDYRNLVKVIQKLDLARREVFVEAVIMEVNLDDNTNFGARLHTGLPPINTNILGTSGQTSGIVADNFGGTGLPPSLSVANLASFGGFLAGLQGPTIPALAKLGISVPSFGVLIHALTTNNNVNVLSTPHILTTDNEEAEITVGQNVPFQSGFAPSSLGSSLGSLTGAAGAAGLSGLGALGGLTGGLSSLYAPIQRQNVELKLKIKPQINEGDTIRMVVDEQTEEIASQDPVLGPTTSKRSAKTTIVVKDQQTVVIGGLIQEHNIESVNKVPVLGDIPLLGHLFREETHHKIRTNLLLFLTPYIIRDQSDFQRIFERKLKERQEFVEEFYGHEKQYEAYIDYSHKAGPLSRMRTALRQEANRIENGGSGAGTGEKLIAPGSSGGDARRNDDLSGTPPSGRPDSAPAESPDGAAAPTEAAPEQAAPEQAPSPGPVHTGEPAPIPAPPATQENAP